MAFLEGYLIGLGLVVLIGPVLFTLLESTLQYGFKSGMAVTLGIFVSDVICVLLCAFGAAPFFQNVNNQFYIGLIGAAILVSFGLRFLLKPPLDFGKDIRLKAADFLGFFTKGFIVNFVNPIVFLIWISIIGLASGKYGYNRELGFYMSGALLGILTTDTLKTIFAHQIKRILKPNIFRWIYKVIGILLFGSGLYMLWRVYNL